MRIPPGVSLLLVGSGIYWLLSSQLISSFTVLSPGLFQSMPSGRTLVTVVGVVSTAAGLWIVQADLAELGRYLADDRGLVYLTPVALASIDVYSTLINLSINSRIVELNPFVASAIGYGPSALFPFLISYLSLSQGLALLMLSVGKWLFGNNSFSRFLPFAIVSGASSFGPLSNLAGMGLGYESFTVYLVAAMGSGALALTLGRALRDASALSRRGPIIDKVAGIKP